MVAQIGLHIRPKGPNVSQLSSVHKAGLIYTMFLIVF